MQSKIPLEKLWVVEKQEGEDESLMKTQVVEDFKRQNGLSIFVKIMMRKMLILRANGELDIAEPKKR